MFHNGAIKFNNLKYKNGLLLLNVHAEARKELVNFMVGLYRNDYNVIPSTYYI